MNKLISILLLTFLLLSCGSDDNSDNDDKGSYFPMSEWKGDWNDPSQPGYLGYFNPPEGRWKVISRNQKSYTDFLVYKFDKNFELLISNKQPVDRYTEPTYQIRTPYQINGVAYKTNNIIYKYGLSNDGRRLRIWDGVMTMNLEPYTIWKL